MELFLLGFACGAFFTVAIIEVTRYIIERRDR